MKVVIAGAGAVGTYLARMLTTNRHEITVVDTDQDKLNTLQNNLDIITYYGDISLISTQKELGMHNTDLLIAVSNYDSVNLLGCIIGKKMGAKRVIARINEQEYFHESESELFKNLGIDHLIFPESLAVDEIVDLVEESAAQEAYGFEHGQLNLLLVKIEKDSPVIGLTLVENARKYGPLEFRAVAIMRNSETIIPNGKTILQAGDQVYVICKPEGFAKLFELSGTKPLKIHNVMILGGSKIGRMAALRLEKNLNVKLVEQDRERCGTLIKDLKETLVICADPHDVSVLKEEGMEKMDAFISVSDNSEENILSCLLAKKMGVPRTIALVDNIEYIGVSQNIGIDTIINKKLIVASNIYKYTLKANIVTSRCLIGVEADVIEFAVTQHSRLLKKKVRDLDFPEGAIMGGVIRNGESFIVTGDTSFFVEDHVIVFCLPEVIDKVEKYFR